jgi:hypothetical protein
MRIVELTKPFVISDTSEKITLESH